jgi:hypothetical protein
MAVSFGSGQGLTNDGALLIGKRVDIIWLGELLEELGRQCLLLLGEGAAPWQAPPPIP